MKIPKGFREILPHEKLEAGDKFWSPTEERYLPMSHSARVGSTHKSSGDGIYIRPADEEDARLFGYLCCFVINEELWGINFTKEKVEKCIPYIIEEARSFIHANSNGLTVHKLMESDPESYEWCMEFIKGAIAQVIVVKGIK